MKPKTFGWVLSLVAVLSVGGGCGLFVNTLPSGQVPDPTPYDRFIEVDGVKYHYLDHPGSGPTVFLLHGYGSSTYTWEGVVPRLAKQGYRVIALDMKGFGWSEKPAGADYAPLTLFREVNSVMEALRLKKVTFVGNSLGGMIAVLMAHEHPERIERVVLVDAAGYPMGMPLIVRFSRVPLAAGFMKLFFGRWVISWNLSEVMYEGKKRMTETQVESYFERLRSEGAINAMIALGRAVDFKDIEPYMARNSEIKMPVLIIWGEDDQWIPLKIGLRFHREIPNSTMVILPECGHIPQEEYPDLVAGHIVNFIEGKPLTGSLIE